MPGEAYHVLNALNIPSIVVNFSDLIVFANSSMKKLMGKNSCTGSLCELIPIGNITTERVLKEKEGLLKVPLRLNDRDYLADFLPCPTSQEQYMLVVFHHRSPDEEWLTAAMDAIPDAILLCDDQLVVRYINPEYTRLKGVNYQDIVGEKIYEVRSGKLIPAVINSGIPINNLYRNVDDAEFTIDIMPIMQGTRIAGGVSISKDLNHINEIINSCNHAIATLKEGKSRSHLKDKDENPYRNIIGKSLPLLQVLEKAKIASKVSSNVLILGETGTGKELIAKAIHSGGERKENFFVAINCAAIPQDLMESELFGYESGAFTGANNKAKIGLFELASEGTIFFDEVGEMTLSMQSKLLRALETKTIRRIGGLKEIPVDVRVIAATNRNLNEMVKRNEFREDLYYRLNVFPIHIPPLRQRPGDIPLLARHIIQKFSLRLGKKVTLSEESLDLLLNNEWPGNVRELENALEYAVNVAETPVINTRNFPPNIYLQPNTDPNKPYTESSGLTPLTVLERQAIQAALTHFGTSTEGKREAAKFLEISLTTLYKKIKEYNIDLTQT